MPEAIHSSLEAVHPAATGAVDSRWRFLHPQEVGAEEEDMEEEVEVLLVDNNHMAVVAAAEE